MSRVTQVSTIHSAVVRVSRNVDAKPNMALAPLRFGFWTIVTMPCIMHHVAYHVKETQELVLVFA